MKNDWENIKRKLPQPVTELSINGRMAAPLIEAGQLCIAQLYITGERELLTRPQIGPAVIDEINVALQNAGFLALRPGKSDFEFAPEAPDLLATLPRHKRVKPKFWQSVFDTREFAEFQKSLIRYLSKPENALFLQLAADPKGFYNLQLEALSQDESTSPEQPAIAAIFNDPGVRRILREAAKRGDEINQLADKILKDPNVVSTMRLTLNPKPPRNE